MQFNLGKQPHTKKLEWYNTYLSWQKNIWLEVELGEYGVQLFYVSRFNNVMLSPYLT